MNRIDHNRRVELCARSHIESEIMLQVVIDACVSNIAILDKFGTIVQVNNAWRLFAGRHGLTAKRYGVGLNYLEICKNAWGISSERLAAVAEGFCRMFEGEDMEFSYEYPGHRATAGRWFMMRAARFDLPVFGDSFRILITHEDITERKRTEESLRDLRALSRHSGRGTKTRRPGAP
jgi:PAS domain S-box-containing protein